MPGSFLRNSIKLLFKESSPIGAAIRNVVFDNMSDEFYLKFKYYIRTRTRLNLKDPVTFNEKLQWLKLYDRQPQYTRMADKYEVKSFVAERIGEEYVVPILGVWGSVEEIDFSMLPDQFVLKCTHDSGGLVICRDKKDLDLSEAKRKLEKSLNTNYFYRSREWPYKDIPHRIIAETFLKDQNNKCLPVYKIFCFHGVPKIIQTIQNDKQPDETIDYFDTKWNNLNIRQNYPNSAEPIEKPEVLSKMLELAAILSEGLPFVRVDLFVVNGRIYFSEYTFYSDAGFARFHPEKWDRILGEWITLPG